jgi:cathepsin C
MQQDVVSCSEYSQGCGGGFPYLVGGKYAQDFGVVEESCFPYIASGSTPCSARCSPVKRYGSSAYEYVGGFYGAANAAVMMREIYTNGPVVVGFEVYPVRTCASCAYRGNLMRSLVGNQDFHFYKGGVYQHTNMTSSWNPLEIVNHAVLAVGWGVTDDNIPYWIIKNRLVSCCF